MSNLKFDQPVVDFKDARLKPNTRYNVALSNNRGETQLNFKKYLLVPPENSNSQYYNSNTQNFNPQNSNPQNSNPQNSDSQYPKYVFETTSLGGFNPPGNNERANQVTFTFDQIQSITEIPKKPGFFGFFSGGSRRLRKRRTKRRRR